MAMDLDSPSYWVAYYTDFSGLSIFSTELAALRFAVDNGMQVKMVGEGVELRGLLT